MSKFKQALMISVMVFLGAFIILSMVKDQMRQERQIQHYRQLDSLLESTGLDYIEDFNPFAETTDMRIGLLCRRGGLWHRHSLPCPGGGHRRRSAAQRHVPGGHR